MTSLWIFLVAAATGFLLTPMAGLLAKRIGIVDHPDNQLKKHDKPIPYLGGVAVYLAFMLALIIFKFWEHSTISGVIGVTVGTTIIVVLGLIDDKVQLTPIIKFIGQILAAIVLIICNMKLEFIHQPVLAVIFTILWVVFITNSMNLIDIMDGLSSGISVIACGILFFIAVQNGRLNDMYILAALGGAALGFLGHNFPKAKIYLGDTGALMMGFILASITMGEDYSKVNPIAVLSPVLVLAVPIFDTLFIMFLRHKKGKSMFRGSPDHLALRMVKLGLSKKQTVMLLWVAGLLLGLIAIASTMLAVQWALLLYLTVGLGALFVAERMGSFDME